MGEIAIAKTGCPTGAAAAPRPLVLRLLPGLAATVAVAAAAYAARRLPGLGVFSPMILAILIGMAWRNLAGTPAAVHAGIRFAARPILRAAIVLLGLQVTLAKLLEIGTGVVLVVIAVVASTYVFTVVLGRILGVAPTLSHLIAAGTSICGASAVVASASTNGAKDEEIAYALSCVTLLGTVAMFGYPFLGEVLALDPRIYGIWAGSSIHEVAQVVAAAFQAGDAAGEVGTVTKLLRVLTLGPVVLAAAHFARAGIDGEGRRPPFPLFVAGFMATVVLGNLIDLSAETRAWAALATGIMMTMALAGLGLEIELRAMRRVGLRPLALGVAASLFIGIAALGMILLVG